MIRPSTILLIGLRGSGKSTLGRELADWLGLGFADLDDLTLRSMGFASVKEAWAQAGEAAFRAAEAQSLRDAIGACEEQGGVIALGGGTPTAPGAEVCIRGSDAVTVYLRGEPSLLKARLSGGASDDRPSLTGGDPVAEIETVFARRDPMYSALADRVLELRAQEEPDETLARLVGLLQEFGIAVDDRW